MYAQGKWETVRYGFFATWTYMWHLSAFRYHLSEHTTYNYPGDKSVGACISLQLGLATQYMWGIC